MVKVRVRPETGRIYFDVIFDGVRLKKMTRLENSPTNLKKAETLASKMNADMAAGTFSLERYFPSTGAVAGRKPESAQPKLEPVVAAAQGMSITVPTYAEFVVTWKREQLPSWRSRTRTWMNSILEARLLPRFGTMVISEIKREHFMQFRSDLAEHKTKSGKVISSKTVNTVMRIHKSIMTEASQRFHFQNPGAGIKRLKTQRTEIIPFTLEEVQQILANVRADFRSYLTVAFFTGMRPGEQNGLLWEHVDFQRREIRVRQTYSQGNTETTKTDGSQREISMSPPVYDALLEQKKLSSKLSDYVFCLSSGEPIHDGNYSKRVWHPLLRHLGLKRRTPYQCRHTAATLWLASGENPQWIAQQLGHTTTEMLFKVYSRFVPNLTRRDGAAFNQLLRNKGFLADDNATSSV